jgi:hypothetical protein
MREKKRKGKERKRKERKENRSKANPSQETTKEQKNKEKIKLDFTCWESNPLHIPPPISHIQPHSTYAHTRIQDYTHSSPLTNPSLTLYTLLFYETSS